MMCKLEVMKIIEKLRIEYFSTEDEESYKRIAIETVMGILVDKYFGNLKKYDHY